MMKSSVYPLGEKRLTYGHATMARPTGAFRKPKKGEWYLSGAIVEAYQAPNDLTSAYHIAKLVTVAVTTQFHVTGLVDV